VFFDTAFTVAVVFLAGPVPALAVVLINWIHLFVIYGEIFPFAIVSVAEVIVIWRLKPDIRTAWPKPNRRTASAEIASLLATITLLYTLVGVAASVLGGLVDHFYFTRMGNYREVFFLSDMGRFVLSESGIHPLAIDILSRFPVNMLDRAFVVFGGFFLALGINKLAKRPRFRKIGRLVMG